VTATRLILEVERSSGSNEKLNQARLIRGGC